MIKIIKLIICLLLPLCLFACKDKKTKDVIEESSSKLVNIEDLTITNQLSTASALEEFYKDDKNTYYFPSIQSEYIICEFSNGDKIPIKQALNDEVVYISDLDTYGIQYWLVDKNGNYINSIDR